MTEIEQSDFGVEARIFKYLSCILLLFHCSFSFSISCVVIFSDKKLINSFISVCRICREYAVEPNSLIKLRLLVSILFLKGENIESLEKFNVCSDSNRYFLSSNYGASDDQAKADTGINRKFAKSIINKFVN